MRPITPNARYPSLGTATAAIYSRVHLKQWNAARGMTIKYTYVAVRRSYATIRFFFFVWHQLWVHSSLI